MCAQSACWLPADGTAVPKALSNTAALNCRLYFLSFTAKVSKLMKSNAAPRCFNDSSRTAKVYSIRSGEFAFELQSFRNDMSSFAKPSIEAKEPKKKRSSIKPARGAHGSRSGEHEYSNRKMGRKKPHPEFSWIQQGRIEELSPTMDLGVLPFECH